MQGQDRNKEGNLPYCKCRPTIHLVTGQYIAWIMFAGVGEILREVWDVRWVLVSGCTLFPELNMKFSPENVHFGAFMFINNK